MAALAGAQFGRVARRQMTHLGVSAAMIGRWLPEGFLHRVLPGVYAVGHAAPSLQGELTAALLLAGPGAALSHATALWWLGLLDDEHRPGLTHVTTPRRCRSIDGIQVHQRRLGAEVVWHQGLRVVTPAQALLDYATNAPRARLRKAIAEAEYRNLLDLDALGDCLGRGQAGSARLREALSAHEPQLARTRSELEVAFLDLCRQHGLPTPEVNVRIAGLTVDALFARQRVIVELDGYGGHHTAAQINRDRGRDLRLRAAGYIVVRYTWAQITQTAAQVAGDLRALLYPL